MRSLSSIVCLFVLLTGTSNATPFNVARQEGETSASSSFSSAGGSNSSVLDSATVALPSGSPSETGFPEPSVTGSAPSNGGCPPFGGPGGPPSGELPSGGFPGESGFPTASGNEGFPVPTGVPGEGEGSSSSAGVFRRQESSVSAPSETGLPSASSGFPGGEPSGFPSDFPSPSGSGGPPSSFPSGGPGDGSPFPGNSCGGPGVGPNGTEGGFPSVSGSFPTPSGPPSASESGAESLSFLPTASASTSTAASSSVA